MPRVVVESFTAYESITVAATALGLTAASINNKNLAFLTLETAEIRYRLDGTAPTSAEGHLLEPGDVLELFGSNVLANFKAIRTGATSGVLKCSYGNS